MSVPNYVPARRPIAAIHHQRISLLRLIRANIFDFFIILRQSWPALLGFLVILGIGSSYLFFSQVKTVGANVLAALYYTLQLLTFQSALPFPSAADPLGQTIFFLLPILGVVLVAQSVINFGRLLVDKRNRREAWQVSLASTFSHHIIVCGLGRVGMRVVTRLIDAGKLVIVIERDWSSEFVQQALALGVPVVSGDARDKHILRQARATAAQGVIAGIDDDLINLEIALAARSLRPGLDVIIRAFDEDFDRNLEKILGSNHAFSVSRLGAPTFAAATISRDIESVALVEDTLLGVSNLLIPPLRAPIPSLRALEEQFNVRALRLQEANNHRPHDLAQLARLGARSPQPGDTLSLLGRPSALGQLRAYLDEYATTVSPLPMRSAIPQDGAIIICALGKVGYRVTQILSDLHPAPHIILIHRNDDENSAFLTAVSKLPNVTLLIGDARDPEVLRAANLDHAYTIAALTSHDLTNLQIGLEARRQNPNIHVVLRVFSDALATQLADLFGIHTAYSVSDLASSTLAAAATLGGVQAAFYLDETLFALTPLGAPDKQSPLNGLTIETVAARRRALIIGLRRNNTLLLPPPYDTTIQPNDELLALAPLPALERLHAH